jgi:hypothetical protein
VGTTTFWLRTGEKKPARRPVFNHSELITSKQPEQQQQQRQQQPKQPKQPTKRQQQRQQQPKRLEQQRQLPELLG